MSTELAGRVSVVTGAGRGIGKGIATAFAREGSKVVIADRDGASAETTAAEIREAGGHAVSVRVDVADEPSVAAAFDEIHRRFPAVDVLVNVAGIWVGGSLTEIAVEDWDRTMNVNARGVFLASRSVLPRMVERKRGTILTVASTAAFKGTRRAGAYNASKAAAVGITRNIALDYAAYGIRAAAICPGLVQTDMEVQLRKFRGDTEEYRRFVLAAHPLGRIGTPEDVAQAAVFLASDRASWITGSCLIVDGGTLA
ncbi:SDR family NAD(P)-dependent oxidoreductase [Pendulispora albinea]|uniref:Glucose 1-dehydrogenase n=1 Tax=Pendulispora albinea TaxID=2741071 RepID=A0ABZ2LWF4_9BACT